MGPGHFFPVLVSANANTPKFECNKMAGTAEKEECLYPLRCLKTQTIQYHNVRKKKEISLAYIVTLYCIVCVLRHG